MFSRFICLVACFILFHCWLTFCCIDVAHFICSSVDRHFGCFHSLGLWVRDWLVLFPDHCLKRCVCWMNKFLPWCLGPCWVDSLYSINIWWNNHGYEDKGKRKRRREGKIWFWRMVLCLGLSLCQLLSWEFGLESCLVSCPCASVLVAVLLTGARPEPRECSASIKSSPTCALKPSGLGFALSCSLSGCSWLDHSRIWLLTHPAPQDRGSEVPKETHGLVSLPSPLAQSSNLLLCRLRPSNSQAAARGQTEQGFPDPVCFLL